jgi:hypothetical protein
MYGIVAIMAALFLGSLAMARGHAKAGEWCKHYDFSDTMVCGHFYGYAYKQQPQHTWDCSKSTLNPNCGFAYTQHPTIQQADVLCMGKGADGPFMFSGNTCHADSAYITHTHHMTQVEEIAVNEDTHGNIAGTLNQHSHW